MVVSWEGPAPCIVSVLHTEASELVTLANSRPHQSPCCSGKGEGAFSFGVGRWATGPIVSYLHCLPLKAHQSCSGM
jgi:hypothetical protein